MKQVLMEAGARLSGHSLEASRVEASENLFDYHGFSFRWKLLFMQASLILEM
jgi:hypothetical protein